MQRPPLGTLHFPLTHCRPTLLQRYGALAAAGGWPRALPPSKHGAGASGGGGDTPRAVGRRRRRRWR
eukprot:358323-Chlamydomonas_euryale.AAC.3